MLLTSIQCQRISQAGLALLLSVLSACSAPVPMATPASPLTVTTGVRQLPAPEPASTQTPVIPTATATETVLPTATPEPSPTPEALALPVAPVSGNTVLLPDIEDPSSGFTSTIVISVSTGVTIEAGVPITTFTQITVSDVPPPVAPVALPEGTINIALLGVDTRPKEGGLNTDVIIIASVHPTLPVVTLLSIPRDTLVYIPNHRMHKVNTAFRYGGKDFGPTSFKQTIKYNFGINIDYYAMVNFAGVVGAVDSLGGIDVIATCSLYQVFPRDPYYIADETSPLTVTVPYTNYFTGEVWPAGSAVPTQTIWIPRAGVYSLNGLQTLAFARARYGVPGGDVDRGRRTQRVIRALLDKVRSQATVATIPTLYGEFSRNVTTDLGVSDLVVFASQSDRFDALMIRNRFVDGVGMTAVTLPGVGAVLVPRREFMTGFVQRALSVQENSRANEGVPVEVWNATAREDFGVAVADRLRELGFRVVDLKQVEPQPDSQVIDFSTSAKGSALPLLQRSFGFDETRISVEPGEQPSGARYRIITGADFDPCYQNGYRFPTAASRPTATPSP
jgi:anionic cell wall polymer biosynthesis LytR-Cps2A-Psr (LCP) family protein